MKVLDYLIDENGSKALGDILSQDAFSQIIKVSKERNDNFVLPEGAEIVFISDSDTHIIIKFMIFLKKIVTHVYTYG